MSSEMDAEWGVFCPETTIGIRDDQSYVQKTIVDFRALNTSFEKNAFAKMLYYSHGLWHNSYIKQTHYPTKNTPLFPHFIEL
jgi:hypothetical protein